MDKKRKKEGSDLADDPSALLASETARIEFPETVTGIRYSLSTANGQCLPAFLRSDTDEGVVFLQYNLAPISTPRLRGGYTWHTAIRLSKIQKQRVTARLNSAGRFLASPVTSRVPAVSISANCADPASSNESATMFLEPLKGPVDDEWMFTDFQGKILLFYGFVLLLNDLGETMMNIRYVKFRLPRRWN